MPPSHAPARRSNFRRFFVRGLGIVLPTVLTIWILVAVYGFVEEKIASPINAGLQELVLVATPWPHADDAEQAEFQANLSVEQRAQWKAVGNDPAWLTKQVRRVELQQYWNSWSVGNFIALNLIGLLIAVVLIYTVGYTLGGIVGRHVVQRFELLVQRVPIFKAIYPYVKQITDFLFADDTAKTMQFNRVVAIQYPRQGIWSIGLVTGSSFKSVREHAGQELLTVFVPSAPTPFTGWVVMVPARDALELPLSIDDALRFCVSGGVIIPPAQMIAPVQASGAG
jgi:uncharacterized membrane protein